MATQNNSAVSFVASTDFAGMRQFAFTVDGSNLYVEITYVSHDASALKFCSDSKYSLYIPPPKDVELYSSTSTPVPVFADCLIFVHTQSYFLYFKKHEVLKILSTTDMRLADIFGVPNSFGLPQRTQPGPTIIFREIIRDLHGEDAFRFMPVPEARPQQPSLFGSVPISTNPFPDARPPHQSDCLFGCIPSNETRPQPVPQVRQAEQGHYMCQSHLVPLPNGSQIFFD